MRFRRKIISVAVVCQIQSADFKVRVAKRSMEDELEAMLDVVNPGGVRSLSLKIGHSTCQIASFKRN